MSIFEIFETFIDIEVIEHLVNTTRRYALLINCPDPKITAEEIRWYVSGYNNLSSKRRYLDSSEDMRRDRFLQICRFLHYVDNTRIDQMDKLWKNRPIIEMLKERCIKFFLFRSKTTMKVWWNISVNMVANSLYKVNRSGLDPNFGVSTRKMAIWWISMFTREKAQKQIQIMTYYLVKPPVHWW